MKMQNLCHPRTRRSRPPTRRAVSLLFGCAAVCASAAWDPCVNTISRVEYVNECMAKSGGKLAALYQCSCAIDRIAATLSYDDFVEASTFAKYATLPGQGGAIFRDSDHARKLASSFRALEADALRGCGVAR